MRALVLALVGIAACTSGVKPAPAKLWTPEDVQALARSGKPLGTTGINATDILTLRGNSIPYLSPPYSSAQTRQSSDFDGLNVFPAFSEGHTASYTTTEVWQGFPDVWVQPLYLLVTGFTGGSPSFITPVRPIFSIGTRSRFYSPFWQVIYVTVPADTPVGKYTSAKQILDGNLPLTEGAGTLCVIAPPDVHLAQAQGAAGPVRPIFGDPVLVNANQGYVDGVEIDYIDFGRFRFEWQGPDDTIVESALFDLSVRAPDGSIASIGLPKIGGTGPLFSNTPARIINGKPMFGAFWHFYNVLLQPGAGVYVPSTRPALRAAVAASAIKAGLSPTIDFVPAVPPQNDDDKYTLRVAANAGCFQSADFRTSCRWLDSQAAVEREIPGHYFVDQDIYATCPFLTFNDLPVTP